MTDDSRYDVQMTPAPAYGNLIGSAHMDHNGVRPGVAMSGWCDKPDVQTEADWLEVEEVVTSERGEDGEDDVLPIARCNSIDSEVPRMMFSEVKHHDSIVASPEKALRPETPADGPDTILGVSSADLPVTVMSMITEEGGEKPPPPPSGFWKYQKSLGAVYKSTRSEIFVACLIVGNFFTNMIEKTLDPDPHARTHETVWVFFDYFYNVCFGIELGINMYSFWLRPFWASKWNQFDFLVVSIGMCSVFKIPLPGPLKLLRMMRAFRVFRLFKRIKSLAKIMKSLAKAVPGVINAFIIQIIVMCIYAILGVEFYQKFGEDGSYPNERGYPIGLETARGQKYGWEYFGNFGKALFTMFQVLTGESWSEVVTRPLIHSPDPLQSCAFAFFFISFTVLNGVVLINVVVAVLLEKMVDDPVVDPRIQIEEDERAAEIVVLRSKVDGLNGDMGKIRKQIKEVSDMLQVTRPAAPTPCSGCSPQTKPATPGDACDALFDLPGMMFASPSQPNGPCITKLHKGLKQA